MEKLKKALEDHSVDSPRAEQIYMETYGLDDRELADYVYAHGDELREILGVKYIAEKDANPELSSAFWKAYKGGEAMRNPDPYSRKDVYGDDLKDIDYYLEKLGVPKEGGAYSDDIRSKYTNRKNSEFVGNADEALVNTRALEDSQDPREWKASMLRAAYDYQARNQAKGYDADNGVKLNPFSDGTTWQGDLLEQLILPRVREARLMGKEWDMRDMAGDLAELGLSFVPGVGMVSKSGKVVADMNRIRSIVNKAGAAALDFGAVPFGAQAYDWVAYDKEDPRGQWSWGRIAGQGAAGASGVGLLKAAGMGAGSRLAAGYGGQQAAKSTRQKVGGFVNDIYYKTDDAIAARQAELNSMAEQAKKAGNVRQAGQGDISGTPYSTDDLINAENYEILRGEADRLKNSAPERIQANSAQARLDQVQEINSRLDKMSEDIAWKNDAINKARDAGASPERIARLEEELDKDLERYWAMKRRIDENAPEIALANNAKKSDINDIARYTEKNEAGAPDIVMLPDGRFVRSDRLVNEYGQQWYIRSAAAGDSPEKYSIWFPGAEYPIQVPKGTKPANFMYGKVTPEDALVYADRNKAAEAAIKSGKYPELARKYSGTWNGPNAEVARDFAVSALANAGAREGVLNNVTGYVDDSKQKLDEKRMRAEWNRDMNRLRTEIMDKAISPEQRREYFDAIMNAKMFGLDNLPDDVFMRNPGLYHKIAEVLGAKDWKHPSEVRVPDQPTTSRSTAIDYLVMN